MADRTISQSADCDTDLQFILACVPRIVEYSDRSDGLVDYCGEFCGGERHGTGVASWNGGKSYAGQWARDVAEGCGYEKFQDGSSYTGTFRGGIRSGVGQFVLPGKYCYCGEWESGLKHGIGKEYKYQHTRGVSEGDYEEDCWVPLHDDQASFFERLHQDLLSQFRQVEPAENA